MHWRSGKRCIFARVLAPFRYANLDTTIVEDRAVTKTGAITARYEVASLLIVSPPSQKVARERRAVVK